MLYGVWLPRSGHPFTCQWCLGWLRALPIVSGAAINMETQVTFRDVDFVSFGYMPSNWVPRSYCRSIFSFMRKLHTVFIMAVLTYLPTSSAQGLLFLWILPSTFFFFLNSLLAVAILGWSGTFLQFWFAFLWWFKRLSILKCISPPLSAFFGEMFNNAI
jgi:hypothetical protein